MRLGNYIKMLMLKNNDLLDKDFYFLNDGDFQDTTEDEINYGNMQSPMDDQNEFKARLFAMKYAKLLYKTQNLKPYSVNDETSKLKKKGWMNFIVLLIGSQGENYLTRVCFTKDVNDNFGLVMDYNKSCTEKVEKIINYQILENLQDNNLNEQMKLAKKNTKKEENKNEKLGKNSPIKVLKNNNNSEPDNLKNAEPILLAKSTKILNNEDIEDLALDQADK
jgi:hypothetical protein